LELAAVASFGTRSDRWHVGCPTQKPFPRRGFHLKPKLSSSWIRERVIFDLFPFWRNVYWVLWVPSQVPRFLLSLSYWETLQWMRQCRRSRKNMQEKVVQEWKDMTNKAKSKHIKNMKELGALKIILSRCQFQKLGRAGGQRC
jgi:hypothetical protein